VRVAPRPGGGLTHARAALETLYGTVAAAWRLQSSRLVLNVTVPPNTTAEVTLWDTNVDHVQESGRPVSGAVQHGQDVVVTVGSGNYAFMVLR
jgi:alpha-L-rhamnosidase